ncbi:MAG: STAS domain-containing protein [Deltaproteobacteria bacterium]|nr:STAS domain-containing protein [Deltaproteobacteria bacterium]
MANEFSVTRSTEGEITLLALEGFLDAHTAPDFEAAVQQEIDAGHTHLIVDAQELTYISSAGLGVFMGFIEEVREAGGDLKICGLQPSVREVFDLLGFDALFDIEADRASATARFSETPSGGTS